MNSSKNKSDYFEITIYDTKCICVNSDDEAFNDRDIDDRNMSIGYDLLIKFKYVGNEWLIFIYSLNEKVNIKVFCEIRNGKLIFEKSGIIYCMHLSDFFKDLL